MKAMSFDAWKAAGFHVKKGSKSERRDPKTGEALFTRDQVEESYTFDRSPKGRRDDGEKVVHGD